MKNDILPVLVLSFIVSTAFFAQGKCADSTADYQPAACISANTTPGVTPPGKLYRLFHYDIMAPDRQRPKQYGMKDKDFSGGNYSLATFARYDLSNANFKNAVLTHSKFNQADLYNADFTGAALMGSDFRKAQLEGVDFSNADLNNVNFKGADMRCAKYNKFTLLPTGFVPQKYGMTFIP